MASDLQIRPILHQQKPERSDATSEIDYVTINGVSVSVLRASKPNRTRILFVHGLWHGAWCWHERFFDYFSQRGYSVYALNVRGRQLNGKRRFDGLSGYRLSEYLEDLSTVADHLGSEETVIVGHSVGGYLTQKLLESREVQLGILLASLPPWGISSAATRFAMHHPLSFLSVLLKRSLQPVVANKELAAQLFLSQSDITECSRRLFQRLEQESFRVFLDALWPCYVNPAKITSPVAVLGSSCDPFVSVSDAHKTAEAYHTKAHLIDGVGHDMMLGDGWERTASWIFHLIASSECVRSDGNAQAATA